jgi:AAT family amino acid transporter
MAIREPRGGTRVRPAAAGGKRRFTRALDADGLTMLTLGGVMGSGLFLASGLAIRAAGTGIILLFAVGLLAMSLEITALGEMSAADPVPGSFLVYCRRVLGPGWTFVSGWIYWFSSVLTMSSEVTAAGILPRVWFSGVPLWIWSLLYSALIVGVNLVGVRSFGTIEAGMAVIKVGAVLAFVALGVAFLAGWLPHAASPGGGLAALAHVSSFAPHGILVMSSGMLLVLFAYAGTGVIGMAAAETRDPARTIPAAVRGTIVLVAVMYLGSSVLLVTMRSWLAAPTASSPFVAALAATGLPLVAGIMNLVLLFAVLSTMNAALYANVRVLYTLAKEHQAPGYLGRLNRHGVPALATAASALLLVGTITLALFLPHKAYTYLVTATGFQAMFIWLMVLTTHLRYRPYLLRQGKALPYRLWGYPYTTILTMLIVVAALGAALFAGLDVTGSVFGLIGILLAVLIWVLARGRLAPAMARDPSPPGGQ